MDRITQLSGYRITEQLYSGSRTLVYRAVRASDCTPVVIKLLKTPFPSFSELVQFRNQYTIAKNLDLPSIVKPLTLEPYQNAYALVMEDFGGVSLKEVLKREGNMGHSLPAFLQIAIQVASALDELYRCRVIHKDLKPANIVIHPDSKQVKLIDFSIASLLPHETQEIQNANALEGTLAYLSPEQTGRMNRGIDYRSDFYALGVTFYELLTGQLPFVSDDPMELLHCHLAKQPTTVNQLNPNVPLVLSEIIGKLMAKNAEDRYQSALGLKHDLELCLHQLKKPGSIEPFELGARDLCDRFLIPEKLYGRKSEVEALLKAFDRVSNGLKTNEADKTNNSSVSSPPKSVAEMMLVAGFSGIGKTAVVNEVHKPILCQRGYFIKGKYDQFQRNIPFSAFVQAFRDLMRQLLAESDPQLQTWKTQILEAVGENGQALIDVIPELERIIGKPLPAPELSGSAAQNRFNLLMQKFVQVFTTADHPLVLFLDDLQWADSASLKLMELLMQDTEHLLVIGAYRDNEVSPVHPLMLTVDEIGKGATVQIITLQPLSLVDINQLVADTLNCDRSLAHPLTELVYKKTQGNPFFATQFLKSLHEDGHVTFDWDVRHWQCDIAQIKALATTDDVVEFMALQLQKLPTQTQDVLRLAACIGAEFDLNTLAIVSQQSPEETAVALWKALQEGLIIPTTEIYKFFTPSDTVAVSHAAANPIYRFLHDRVQQAAYFLIPDDQRQAAHLKIGQLLLSSSANVEQDKQLFEIVNQLNTGRSLIFEPGEQIKLAQLNLTAGRKAKASTAYTTAANYLRTGIELVGSQGWQHSYDLTLPLYRQLAEVEFLCGNFDESVALVKQIVLCATDVLTQAEVHNLLVVQYTFLGQHAAAIAVGIEALKLLGIDISNDDLQPEIQQEIQTINNYLQHHSVLSLLDTLSETTDPKIRIAVQLLVNLDPPVYITSNLDLYTLISAKIVALSLEYGYIPETVKGYGNYGWLSGIVLGDYKSGYDFGVLGMSLARKLNNRAQLSKISLTFGSWIHSWSRPVSEILHVNDEGYEAGLESGEVLFGGWNLFCKVTNLLFGGTSLDIIDENLHKYLPFAAKTQNGFLFGVLGGVYFLVQELLRSTPTANSSQANGEIQLDRQHYLELCETAQDFCSLSVFYIWQMQLSCIKQTFHEGLNFALAAKRTLKGALGFTPSSEYPVYESLILLNLYAETAPVQQTEYLQQVQRNQAQYKVWTDNCPENFLHKYLLVEAEFHRVTGEIPKAVELYDRAIATAKEYRFTHIEALASELAAKFYLEWGKERVAQTYLVDAYYAYSRWGAKAKVDDLEQRYPQLLGPILLRQQQSISATETILSKSSHTQTYTSSSTSISESLDLATLLKAAQMLSSEIELDKLLSTLLHVVLENAGADKCALLMPKDDRWVVEALSQLGQLEVILQSVSIADSQAVPVSLINTVKHTLQPVVMGNAMAHPTLAADPYIQRQRPKSILCAPLLSQGKLIGILYLENNLTIEAFTSDRIQLLNLICGQAVISLENARLYQQSQDHAQELERSLEQLQRSETQLRQLFESSADAILLLDNGVFIDCNPAAVEMMHCQSKEQFLSLHPSDLSPEIQPDGRSSFEKANEMIAIAFRKSTHRFEWMHRRGKGEDFWVEVILTVMPYKNRNIIHAVWREINDRKQAEQQLQESQQLLQWVLNAIPHKVFWKDCNLVYEGSNRAFAEVVGFSSPTEIVGKSDYELSWTTEESDWFRKCDRRVIESDSPELGIIETTLQADGTTVWIETSKLPLHSVTGTVIGVLGIYQDITDRKQAEQALQQKSQALGDALTDLQHAQIQIVQSEKMSALGNLVAGIAHEINNPIGFLDGNINPALDYIEDMFGLVDLYQQEYPQPSSTIQDEIAAIDLEFIRDDLPKLVGSMREGVKRIRDISTSLRTFSRADRDHPVPCNIHDGIDSTLLILKHRLKANESRPEISVITEYGNLPEVECFAGQLNQVFMNLLANAIDTLEDVNQGRTFAEIKTHPNQITIKTALSSDYQVLIRIQDNGKGMTDEVKQKIFNHLFTTKGVGQGTGLGLAIARQIVVEKHAGTLEVNSTFGQGTEFVISIPVNATVTVDVRQRSA